MAHQTFFKSDMPTRAEGRTASAKAIETARRVAYREAEQRDGLSCRVCGRKVRKGLTLGVDRLEHHHINGRGTIEYETSGNVAITCKGCHDDRHVRRTLHLSGDANGRLRCEHGSRIWFSEMRPGRVF